jgi:MoaA/NifB/PqqE/SkfB family radical SAM enzyme
MFERITRLKERFATERIAVASADVVVRTLGAGRISTVPIAKFRGVEDQIGDEQFLPHWGRLQRYIHRRCRNSRKFNSLVAAVEMRLGREELLSLPQYMALCPTGQCNALCDFCSVTLNRTGILKQQLPYDRLNDFLRPVSNTIRLYGMEGNGEPTLYAFFPELVDSLTRRSTSSYLITNGSRLNATNIPLLLNLESVNFSLNAATAKTHRAVMKLKNFQEIAAAIKALVRERGIPGENALPTPQISVSYVVTADNIHETQEFLRFAEQELGVDVIWVRPLSELGNDIGVVEDLRHIVPYESDIRDMLDSVQEYLRDVPRRADIRIASNSFNSVRPDPVGRLVLPKGFEGRLLAPRRGSWTALDPDVSVAWNLNTARIRIPARTGPMLCTEPFEIQPQSQLSFMAKAKVAGGPVTLQVVDQRGVVIGEALCSDHGDQFVPVAMTVKVEEASSISLRMLAHGKAAEIDLDFERLRTPSTYHSDVFKVPIGRRWQVCVDGGKLEWNDRRLRFTSRRGGGPYLLKSYAIPCAQNSFIDIPVDVLVRESQISIGILSQDESHFIESFDFCEGESRTSLSFHTAGNQAVRIVVTAEPGKPVDGAITWLEEHKSSAIAKDRIALPSAMQWMPVAGAIRARTAERLELSCQGGGTSYLFRSNGFTCIPWRQISLDLALRVDEGAVGVGVLNSRGSRWLAQTHLHQGEGTARLQFNAEENTRVSIVLFGVAGSPFRGDLHLGSSSIRYAGEARTPHEQVAAARTAEQFEHVTVEQELVPIAAEAVRPEVVTGGLALVQPSQSGILLANSPSKTDPAPQHTAPGEKFSTLQLSPEAVKTEPAEVRIQRSNESLTRQVVRWLFGRPKYFCQKPWTDLNNFSVDGRMDVCCIATGPSQERYQLGNLNRHRFQEVWNGPMAKEFRRTVNTDPLPPCQRCPMVGAFQGPGFDPNYTAQLVTEPLHRRIKRITRSQRLADAAERSARFLINAALFRGFKSR